MVFDAVGKSSYRRSRALLKPGGIYLTTVPSLPILVQMLWTSKMGNTRAAIAFTGLRKAPAMAKDVAFMGELTTAGNYVPVIDKQYTLTQAAAAHAHVETGRKKGKRRHLPGGCSMSTALLEARDIRKPDSPSRGVSGTSDSRMRRARSANRS